MFAAVDAVSEKVHGSFASRRMTGLGNEIKRISTGRGSHEGIFVSFCERGKNLFDLVKSGEAKRNDSRLLG